MKSYRARLWMIGTAFALGMGVLGCSSASGDGSGGNEIDPETDGVPLDTVIDTAGIPDITWGTQDFTPLSLSNTLADRTFVAFLSPGQEVPPTNSTAFGTMALVLNAAGTKLKFILRHNVQNATLAHFHNAPPGENGDVAIALPNADQRSSGVVSITQQQADELRAGRLYVNVHSTKNTKGEIRGQVLRPGETLFSAVLSGAEEVPSNDSTASAVGSLILGPARDQIKFRLKISGVTPTLAHIHRGIVGVNGPVVYPLAPLGEVIEGIQAIKKSDVDDLTRRQWYFNVHSMAHPTGEMRGQIVRPGETYFGASLNSAQERPPSTSTSMKTGNGMVMLGMAGSKFLYQLTTDAVPTLAHIHKANGGISGPIEVPLQPVSQAMFGIEDLGPMRAADVARGLWYFNVHTVENQNGDIRGQILRPGETLFTSILSGQNEVPPTTSMASGGVGLILNAARNEVRYDGSVTNLMPTLAHVHDNVAGMNGPVLFPLMLTGTTVSGNQPLTPDQVTKLISAGLYVNFHSMEFPTGAVRGQITVPTLVASPPPPPPPPPQKASGILDSAPNFAEPDGSQGIGGDGGECRAVAISKTGSIQFVTGTMTLWTGAGCNSGKSWVINADVKDFGAFGFRDQVASIFIGDNDKTPPASSAILDNDKNLSDVNGSERVSGAAGSCQNLSKPSTASSVSSTGRLTLFDAADCKGTSVVLTGDIQDLDAVGFDNRAVSVQFK